MSREARWAREVLADVVNDLGPPTAPVKFRICLPKDGEDYADVWRVDSGKKPYFLVRLARGMDQHRLRDTVVHELAHIYAWEAEGVKWRDEHDALWGVTYAKVYCAAFGVS